MLGHRGVRLGITYPEITEMQTRAIMEAACKLNKEGLKVVPEIMIPLVGDVRELRDQKAIVDRVCAEVMKEKGIKIKYLVGTMIEVPRGALTADEVAKEAEFFSFGTNDLTQMAFGFSRDDVGKFLRVYQDKKILEQGSVCDLRRRRHRPAGRHRREEGPRDAQGPQARHLRRARRRSVVGALLPQGGPRLRELLAVPRAGGAPGRGAGRTERQGRRLIRYFVHRGGRTELVDRLDPAWLSRTDSRRAESVWADVAEPTEADGAVLRDAFGLHELVVEAAFQRETNPKVEPYGHYLYIVLHGINFDAIEHRFETHETDFFLSPKFLVTVHDGQRRSIAHISEVCTRAQHVLGEGTVALLHRIIDTMVDHYRPEVDELEDAAGRDRRARHRDAGRVHDR